MFKAKFYFMVVVTGLLGVFSAQAQDSPIRVLCLSATSSQNPKFDLTSLLDHSATVGWKPGITGTGAEEGISIQFEKPVYFDAVFLYGKGDFVVSMNGVEISENSGYFYVPGNIGVKTLFIHVASHPTGPVDLTGIKLCRGGVALPVEKPLMVPGEVEASNVLSPKMVYGPFRLFDSRPDLAFSLDGKKIDPTKPIPLFNLQLKKTERLEGFFIWNGCELSDELYDANTRPKVITVRNADASAKFTLEDKTGPQWFSFPGTGWDVSSLSFEANSIYPGGEYKDLLISEVCFVTDRGRILMVKVPRPSYSLPDDLKKVIDQSLASLSAAGGKTYKLKFRNDGTFAAIRETDQEDAGTTRKIWEGYWNPVGPNQVQVFGKSYSSDPSQDEGVYGNEVLVPQTKTFQTTLTFTDLSNPSSSDRDRIFKFVTSARSAKETVLDPTDFWNQVKTQDRAVFVESNLFSQVMVRDEFPK